MDDTQPLKHPVSDAAWSGVALINFRREVSNAEGQVILHTHQERGARAPRAAFFDGDDAGVSRNVAFFHLILRRLLKCPGLIHSITDGRGAPEAALLVGVVNDKHRGCREQHTVVAGQPVQRRGEVRLVLVKSTATATAN